MSLEIPLLGIEHLDEQHARAIKFLQASETVANPKDLSEVENYIYEHFDDEEKFMESQGYPATHPHKVAHNDIRGFIAFQISRLSRLSSAERAVFFSKTLLMLTDHINDHDQMLATWLQKKS